MGLLTIPERLLPGEAGGLELRAVQTTSEPEGLSFALYRKQYTCGGGYYKPKGLSFALRHRGLDWLL